MYAQRLSRFVRRQGPMGRMFVDIHVSKGLEGPYAAMTMELDGIR